MMPTQQGSFRLFNFKGIDVHMHWSWLFVAMYSVSTRVPYYETKLWAVWEYLALFVIVLLHEFGHAFACRQVGGKSDQIVLWPLGGVAYGRPPPRPGANLWTIVAGPLVNVVLIPITYGIFLAMQAIVNYDQNPDIFRFGVTVLSINFYLLIFNVLPVYPLDGGQILRSLLWYPLGQARSLLVATVVGFIGGALLVGLALWQQRLWYGIMAFFLLSNCWQSFKYAKELRRVELLPRRPEFKCPSCHASPPRGNYWLCQSCRQPFDPFATAAQCPHCSAVLAQTACPDCGEARDQRAWDASIRDA